MFLMRYWKRTGKEEALAMVKKTLQAMRRGGIYDHLGFGFARYSTDARWLAPHFEKMLYDNALLCYAYLEAYQCTGETDFSQVASEIITYVLRDMTDGAGGFYSAEDADSEGVEGKFYVWSKAEIIEALGPEDGAIFAGFYEITDQGNFEHGNSILNYIEQDYSEYADKVHLSQAELKQVLAAHREKLYQLRKKRIPPYKDDKVLMAWNGLMIAALAKGARVLGRKEWALAAERGVNFIYEKMQREDGRFFARYREGEAAHLAYLDDYAFLLWGLLELYEATFKLEYIEKAVELSQQMKGLFWDEEQGGFFFYGTDGEVLLTKPKELYDGAIPSGNSVAILSLLRLGRMMNREEWLVTAEKALKSFAGEVSVHPKAYTYYLMGLEYYLSSPRQVVIAGEKGNGDTQAMLSVVHRCFLPDTVIVVNDPQDQMKIGDVLPHILEQEPVNGHAAAYICEDFACHPPLTTVAALHETLN